jgi:4'-phosphopantetheinyl transferase
MQIEIFDHMEECTEETVQYMLPLVNEQRREQALKNKHTFGRFCCLKSWLMLHSMCPRYALDKGSMTFLYNEYGKPYLENGPYFSISHCKEGIAVAVSEHPIGIDIESIRHVDDDLVSRVMNNQELAQIVSTKEPPRIFTRLWTQKEAIVKAQGTGITSFDQLQTILGDKQWSLETFENANYIFGVGKRRTSYLEVSNKCIIVEIDFPEFNLCKK